MKFRVEKSLPLAALTLLAACGGPMKIDSTPQEPRATSGPAGDYPIVIGPAYTLNGITYSPSDTMNYDVVGRASVGSEGGASITAAHHTLPLPSYIEMTELSTGKTILVRVERRGPMTSNAVIELSPGAAAQLGVIDQPQAAVRIRRVNPIESERAVLRGGQVAPARMDTPKSLLSVLLRKLDQQEGVTRPAPAPAPAAALNPPPKSKPKSLPKPPPATPARLKPAGPTPAPTPAPVPTPAPKAAPAQAVAPTAVRGGFYVQIGAFSSQANAKAAAAAVGGSLAHAGKVWRVRMGPFATESQARAALAKARAAGYGDARIQNTK